MLELHAGLGQLFLIYFFYEVLRQFYFLHLGMHAMFLYTTPNMYITKNGAIAYIKHYLSGEVHL